LYLFDIANEPCPLCNKLGSNIIGDNPIDNIEMNDDKITTNDAIIVSEPIDAGLLDVFSSFLGVDFIYIEGLFSFEDTDRDDSFIFLFINHNDGENIYSHFSCDKDFSISLNGDIVKNDTEANGRMDAIVYDDKKCINTNKIFPNKEYMLQKPLISFSCSTIIQTRKITITINESIHEQIITVYYFLILQ